MVSMQDKLLRAPTSAQKPLFAGRREGWTQSQSKTLRAQVAEKQTSLGRHQVESLHRYPIRDTLSLIYP